MRIEESFVVPAPPEAVWRFFENVERVARCVPGVQTVETVDHDRYRVVATQKVGFISATFEMATRIDERQPGKLLVLSSVGKSIKGAVGTLRSQDRVDFAPAPDGGTRVTVTSELVVGGMLGTLGHKAIVTKSKEITEQFAAALRAEIVSAMDGPAPRTA